MDIPDESYDRICDLCEEGNALAEKGEYSLAILRFEEAFAILPLPPVMWDAYTWIKLAIGDSLFLQGKYGDATEFLFEAMNGIEGACNPFLLLRLGQSMYETNKGGYEEFLCRAYVLDGFEVFKGEDIKYLDVVRNSGLLKRE